MQNKYPEALSSFESVLKINPNNVNALVLKSLALFHMNRLEEATTR